MEFVKNWRISMPKISIIVPVYNCEKYISNCINSILEQSFKDFELILVDDGSSDRSFEICESFVKKDSRVKAIHQQNSGVSRARNRGLDEVQGEYIGFVDGDDCVDKEMYERLYKNLADNDADISICGIVNYFLKKDGTTEKVRQSQVDGFWIFSGEQALKEALQSRLYSVNPVNKLFKRELFDKLRYPEGKISEDAFLIPVVISKANRVVYDSKPMYYYLRRENSITTSNFSYNDWDVVEAYENHLNMISEKFPNLKKVAKFRYLWSYTYVIDKIMICENSENYLKDFKKAFDFIKKNILQIIFNPYFSFKRKIAVIVLLLNKKIYKKMIMKVNKR